MNWIELNLMQNIATGLFYVGNNWTVLVKFHLGEVFDNISQQHLKLIERLRFSSKPSRPSINNAASLKTGSFSKQLLRSKGCGGARIHTRAVGRQRQMKMKGRLKGQRYTKEFKQALRLLHLGGLQVGNGDQTWALSGRADLLGDCSSSSTFHIFRKSILRFEQKYGALL